MLVCPSDHHIGDPEGFRAAAHAAAALAAQDLLVSFGTSATWLRLSEKGRRDCRYRRLPPGALCREARPGARAAVPGRWRLLVKRRIFVFRAGFFLSELATHCPALFAAMRDAVEQGREDSLRFHPEPAAFDRVENESVDYAVMENTKCAAMAPATMAWSDIGNWQAHPEALDRDTAGKATRTDAVEAGQ